MSPTPHRRLGPARDVIQSLLRRSGWELRRATPPPPPTPAQDVETIPRGRTEPFSTIEYDVLPKGGFDVVRHDYYSPVPDLAALPEEVWTRRAPLAGVALDTEAAMRFVESELASRIAELDVPRTDPGGPGRFFMENQGFEAVDAELLYAMVRAMRPGRVLELGSGYTTLLINQACRENAAAGIATRHEAFDPYPRPFILGDELPPPTTLAAVSATDVPLDTFAALGERDILFVDTTHTVKLAGDVNFIVLEVLPILAPGVIVHFHDIFLPWEYPRVWFEAMHWYWAEQYLLQAFLAHNRDFEILVPAHAMARDLPERCAAVFPFFRDGVAPGSMWLRRR
jgi:Methyltransferase domain